VAWCFVLLMGLFFFPHPPTPALAGDHVEPTHACGTTGTERGCWIGEVRTCCLPACLCRGSFQVVATLVTPGGLWPLLMVVATLVLYGPLLVVYSLILRQTRRPHRFFGYGNSNLFAVFCPACFWKVLKCCNFGTCRCSYGGLSAGGGFLLSNLYFGHVCCVFAQLTGDFSSTSSILLL
jgi:hypothetical protein